MTCIELYFLESLFLPRSVFSVIVSYRIVKIFMSIIVLSRIVKSKIVLCRIGFLIQLSVSCVEMLQKKLSTQQVFQLLTQLNNLAIFKTFQDLNITTSGENKKNNIMQVSIFRVKHYPHLFSKLSNIPRQSNIWMYGFHLFHKNIS